jgi:YidC/Oxa1 family membrane protein insertase
MFDRTTWAVLAICGGLLVTNLYFQQQNQVLAQKEKQKQEALQKANATAAVAPVRETSAELTVEPPLPPTEEETVTLKSEKVEFTLTNIGGGIKYAEFSDQFEVGSKTEHVRANRHGSGPIGAIAGSGESLENVPYAYKADESQPGNKAVYIAKLPSGLIVKKTYSLVKTKENTAPDWWDKVLAAIGLDQGKEKGAPYLMDLDLRIENSTQSPVTLNQWSVFLGEASPLYQKEWAQQTGFFWREDGSINFKDAGSFSGGMFSSEKSVHRSPEGGKIGFAGVTNQFFASALQPKDPAVSQVWAKPTKITLPGESTPVVSIRAGLQLPAASLSPAEIKSFQYRIFIGPKHNPLLRSMEKTWGVGWGDLMQYGWFGFVSRPLNWLLNTYHGWLDGIAKNWSWGLAIILLTITVRTVIWPLHAKSTRTMKRMAKLKPEMDKLREQYADDPNKLNTETMGLYRKFGINPLGGCLPMLIQIPIFFGFYRMLQYAVELRGHGFLWVPDLSQPDTLHTLHLPFALPLLGENIPLNLLPVVMAITSFLQIKMTPMTGDKMQQRIITFMPFMFFFFCYSFASALALYWTTQNIFSIAQTWLMNKVPEPELKPIKGSGKKSWVQRMAERQAELQKQQLAKQRAGASGDLRDVTPDKKKRPPRTGG